MGGELAGGAVVGSWVDILGLVMVRWDRRLRVVSLALLFPGCGERLMVMLVKRLEIVDSRSLTRGACLYKRLRVTLQHNGGETSHRLIAG